MRDRAEVGTGKHGIAGTGSTNGNGVEGVSGRIIASIEIVDGFLVTPAPISPDAADLNITPRNLHRLK